MFPPGNTQFVRLLLLLSLLLENMFFFIVFDNLIDVLLFVSQYRVSLPIRIDRDQLLLITKQGRNLHHNNFLFIKLSQLFSDNDRAWLPQSA